MADDVNIRVVTEDDSTAVWQELYKMFGDTQEQLDKLACLLNRWVSNRRRARLKPWAMRLKQLEKRRKKPPAFFGQLGQAIMQGLGLGLACLSLRA